MSTEIATWNMIRSKISTFPSPSSGRGNECLTKTEIQSLGGQSLSINGNYSNSECVILDHIEKVTWEYTFSVSPTSLNFSAIGGTQSVTVTSYKRKYIGGVYSGEQINVGFSSSPSDSWLSSSGTSVTVSENTVTSGRSGTVNYTQAEKGTIIPVTVGQDQANVRISYEIDGAGAGYMWGKNDTSMKTRTITAWKRTYINGRKTAEIQCVWDAVTTGANGSHWQVSSRYAYLEISPATTNQSGTMLSAKVEFNVIADSGYHRANEYIQLNHSPNPYV